MTQLMGRPILEVPGELGGRPVLADLLTGVRTALVGLAVVTVPVVGLWIVTPYADSGAAGATRLAGALWLLGHGAPVLRGGGDAPLTVTPLLLAALAAVRLYRAAAGVVSRRALRSSRSGPLALWSGYCAVAVAVALHCAGGGPFRSRVLPDLLAVGLFAALAVAAGVRSARPGPAEGLPLSLLDRLPPGWRPTGGSAAVRRAAGAAGAGLVAAGGALVAVAAVVDAMTGGGRGMSLLRGGPAALLGLLLLTVLLLPNAVLWGSAYALGPGFVVGAGTRVSPGGTELGPVPEFPLFALLPEEGPGGWRLAALALPLLAGVVPAVLLGRAAAGRPSPQARGAGPGETHGTGDGDEWGDGYGDGPGGERVDGRGAPWPPAATVAAALAAALLLGAGAAVLGRLSGGALAGGRMAWLGPVPWWTGPAAAGWFALVAVPGALLVRHRALAPAAPRARAATVGACARLSAPARRSALRLRARTYALVRRLAGGDPTG
ncbi:DUF6350 family protein [Kitasatospora sp. NPDC048194]|uniref:cell division protein PerM n=1 Tax=Kitasatospora sp. NPDC048194 TaxID=3364045 RepID=UPI003722F81E